MHYAHEMMTQLPDPEYDADMYADVPSKRFMAWVIDVVLISVVVALLVMMSLFIALIFLPALYFMVSFGYRWLSLTAGSATPGMWLMAIEIRDRHGQRLDPVTAFLHTAGYAFSVVTVPLQLVSVAMMLTTARRQGLTDMVLGTAALNRPAR